MTVFKNLLMTCTVLTCFTSLRAQNAISPASSLFGHVAVTVLTPAALSDPQSLLFKDIDLGSDKVERAKNEANKRSTTKMTAGSIRIIGSHSVYSVTLSTNQLDIKKDGKQITISDFTAESQTTANEGRQIRLGGVLRLSSCDEPVSKEVKNETLALMVNYN